MKTKGIFTSVTAKYSLLFPGIEDIVNMLFCHDMDLDPKYAAVVTLQGINKHKVKKFVNKQNSTTHEAPKSLIMQSNTARSCNCF